MADPTNREIYADWWYDVIHRTDGAVNAMANIDANDDLSDYIGATSTLLSFAINPRAWDPPILDPRETDPYSYAISTIRAHLSGIIQYHADDMNEAEFNNLIAIEEFIRTTDNA